MTKFIFLLLLFIPVLSTPSLAKPLYHVLKGITAISFDAGVEKAVGGDHCTVNWQSLKIALLFVANQSVKLKIIADEEHNTREHELIDTANQIFSEVMARVTSPEMMPWKNDKYIAAKKVAADYAWMPRLHINISPVELPGGCGGSVRAYLDAYVDDKTRESLEILPTHRRIHPWTIEIWSSEYSIIGPKETFAAHATQVAEDLMREFVNDWTTSQDLEDLWEPPKQ